MSLTSGRRLPGCPWTTASGRGPAFGVSFLWVHAAKGANSEARTWPAGILLHFPPLMSQCWRDPAEPSAGFKPQGDTEVDLGGPEAAHTHPPPSPQLPGDTAKREGSMASSFCSPQNRKTKTIPGALANTLFPPN